MVVLNRLAVERRREDGMVPVLVVGDTDHEVAMRMTFVLLDVCDSRDVFLIQTYVCWCVYGFGFGYTPGNEVESLGQYRRFCKFSTVFYASLSTTLCV
jgi:hypothetical protein